MEKKVRKRLKTICGTVFFVFLIGFIWYSYGLYQKKTEIQTYMDPPVPAVSSAGEVQNTIEYQGKVYERDPSIKSILLLGVDSAGDMEKKVTGDGGQADGIFLIAFNAAKDTIQILMIPRDTMTPITLTDLSGNVLGKDRQHLTLAYAYGDGRELSCERMSEAVSELLDGLSIDGYMAMNTDMIRELNDLVGGVTVTVEVDGMEKRDPALARGSTVTLTGRQAEIFVRFRDVKIDNSAITRMSQQRQYIEAYMKTVKQQAAKDNQTIVKIMSAIEGKMITNMSKPQYMEMGAAILNSSQSLGQEDILVIPGEAVLTDMFDEFHHDPEGTKKMVLDLFYREK